MKHQALWAALFSFTLLAAAPPTHTFTNAQGVAIAGYDPVAYFTDGRPTPGDAAHALEWNGAKWLFATAAHRDTFKASPEKYAPQYGGFCAYGMSRGYKAIIDPTAWTIIDGKLYLNYNAAVQQTWRKDTTGYIRKADTEWPRVKDTPKVHR